MTVISSVSALRQRLQEKEREVQAVAEESLAALEAEVRTPDARQHACSRRNVAIGWPRAARNTGCHPSTRGPTYPSANCLMHLQLEAKDGELRALRPQFEQLKGDFLHNEGVLRERDSELAAAEHALRAATAALDELRPRAAAAEEAAAIAQSQLRSASAQCVPRLPTLALARVPAQGPRHPPCTCLRGGRPAL